MLICRNAEGVNGHIKVGNSCSRITHQTWTNRCQGRRRAGTCQGRGSGAGAAFFITVSQVTSWFIKIELKQIYCRYYRTRKIQNVFLQCLLFILRSRLSLNRNKHLDNDFFCFL